MSMSSADEAAAFCALDLLAELVCAIAKPLNSAIVNMAVINRTTACFSFIHSPLGKQVA